MSAYSICVGSRGHTVILDNRVAHKGTRDKFHGICLNFSAKTRFVHVMSRNFSPFEKLKEILYEAKKPLFSKVCNAMSKPWRGGRVVEGAPLLRE